MRFLTEILAKAGITSNYVQLDTLAATPGGAPGRIVWNDVDGTLEFQMKGGNVTQQIGQELPILVKHADNTGLTNGKVVYQVSSDGTNITVRYASASIESASSKTFGVMTEDASGGAKAFCTTFGLVRDINTSALTEGSIIWLSETAGEMTTTRPTQPAHGVIVGRCIRQHATQGVIFVSVQNGFELDELHDVLITSKANNDFIVYESATSLWKNKTIAAVLGYTPANDSNVVKLTGDQTVAGVKTFTSVVNAPTLSLNGGILAGNNIVSMRSNPTGGQFRIEKSDGSLSAYPFYIGVDGTALAYYYNAAGALKVLLHTNDTSYFGNSLSIGYSTYASTSYMLDVNGTARFVGALTGTSATFTNPVTIGNYDGQALKLQSATSTGSSYLRFYNSAAASRGYLGLFWNGTSDYMVLDAGSLEMNFGSSNKFTFTGGGTAQFSGAVTTAGDVTISTGSIKLYTQQNVAGQYRFIGTEYAAGNGNNKAEIRFGIDGSDTRTKISFHVANGGGTINEALSIGYTGAATFAANASATNFRVYNGSTTGGYLIPKAGWVGSGTDYSPSIAAETTYGINFFTNGSASVKMYLATTGQLQLNTYTSSSSYTGTAAGYLAFDSSGNVITVAGVASTVTAGFSLTTQGAANNTPSTPSVNAGVYAGVYAFIDLATQNENGGWIDFSKGDGSDFAGRIRYYANPERFGFHTAGGVEKITFDAGGNIVLLGGSSSAQSSLASGLTAIRFPNQYSSGYTDAGVKLYIFNSGTTIQGFTAGPAYDLQYHSSGSDSGRHAFYVANSEIIRFSKTIVGVSGILQMSTSGTSYISMGRFPNSVSNSGEAWLGRASDRSTGSMTVQLGGSSNASFFEVVDYGWTTVTLRVGMNDFSYKGNAVIHAGNIGSQSVSYASTAGTASNITAYTINQSVGTGNSPSFAEGIFGSTGGATNQGIQIRYQNYVSGYGRIRFYQSDSNHATIHVFSSSWQNGTLAGSSTGAINLDSGTGVTFGAWNNPDAYVVTGGQTYARGYRGIGNVAGTGEATYHPAGIYSTGNNWLYGNIMMNNYSISGANTISAGGLITGGTVRSNTNIYTDQNYGYGLVGVYTSTRYQGVFAMGDSYKLPADGSSTGSLYGLAWSHPNAGGVASNLNTHGLLVMENGSFLAAISGSIRARDDVRAPILRVTNSTNNSYITGDGSWGVKFQTDNGFIWIGPANSGTAHIYTDRPSFYFNVDTLLANGNRLYTDIYRPYADTAGSLSGFDKTNPSFGAVYASNWFRAQGDCGLYSQDYGGHFRRNATTYGTWQSFGYTKNGWGGYVTDYNYIVAFMNNYSGDHGFYQENGNGWTLFYNRGNNCWGIGTDNTYSGDGFRCVKYGSAEYGWTTWSDRRAKENISTITGALDTVLAMRGVYYNYIKDEAKVKRVGFIAQELMEVLPEAVRYADEIDEYNVNYDQIVSVLAEAIKEQDTKMQLQEEKIALLQAQLQTLLN